MPEQLVEPVRVVEKNCEQGMMPENLLRRRRSVGDERDDTTYMYVGANESYLFRQREFACEMVSEESKSPQFG